MLQAQAIPDHNAQRDPVPISPPHSDAPDAYEPPAIVYRAPLEVTAAFCDNNAGGKTPVESCFTVINS
jgi:hypothetical protein